MRPSSILSRLSLLGVLSLLIIGAVSLHGVRVEASDEAMGGSYVAVQQQEDGGGYDPEANLPFLFAAFIVAWAGLFGYVFVMTRRRREMQGELDSLKKAIAEQGLPGEPQETYE